MKKILVLLLLVPALVMVACTKAPEAKPAEAPAMKIAIVTDVGGVNDQSFNQSAWEGLQKAEKELGVRASYKESKQNSDYAPNLETILDAKNDLIWGIGFMMGDAIYAAATKNPGQKYAIIDMAYDKPLDNLLGVVFKAEQPSFLVGYIAGKMTKTKNVGFVGGMDFPVIHSFHYGYLAGVKQANPDVKVQVQYAGSFSDAAKGKSIALQMFQQGADIVFHAAGDTGAGVIEAAKEQGKFAIGVDRDQNYLAPNNVITSAMKRVDNGIYNVAKDLKAGKFKGGLISYGLAEGGVDIAPTSSKLVPASILKEVDALKARIIKGEIVVPVDKPSFEAYKVK